MLYESVISCDYLVWERFYIQRLMKPFIRVLGDYGKGNLSNG